MKEQQPALASEKSSAKKTPPGLVGNGWRILGHVLCPLLRRKGEPRNYFCTDTSEDLALRNTTKARPRSPVPSSTRLLGSGSVLFASRSDNCRALPPTARRLGLEPARLNKCEPRMVETPLGAGLAISGCTGPEAAGLAAAAPGLARGQAVALGAIAMANAITTKEPNHFMKPPRNCLLGEWRQSMNCQM